MTEPERDLAVEFAQCKDELERALVYAGGSHTLQDVYDGVRDGRLQLWLAPHSVVVTELQSYPQFKSLHYFLAAGRMPEIEAMIPAIMEWGKTEGCTKASLVGRPGWARSWLVKDGWRATSILMSRDI